MTTGYVYAIDGGDTVKIGWSGDPQRRFSKIRSDNPGASHIIGFISATLDQEKALHDLLAPWRIRREWYRNEGAVTAFLEMLPPMPRKRRYARRNNRPGNILRDHRLSIGMTTRRLGELAGVSYATISRIERNVMEPSLDALRKISAALDGALSLAQLAAAFSDQRPLPLVEVTS